jgi:hypothetical protein
MFEVTTSYDPCICSYSGEAQFFVQIYYMKESSITLEGKLTGRSETVQKLDDKGKGIPLAQKISVVQKAGSKSSKAFKGFNKWSQNIDKDLAKREKRLKSGKLNAWDKVYGLLGTKATGAATGAAKFSAALPYIGLAVGAVSFISNLVSPDAKKSKTVMVTTHDMNLTLDGEITSEGLSSPIMLDVPGSYNQDVINPPIYDNPLGVFGFLEYPEVAFEQYSYKDPSEANCITSSRFAQIYLRENPEFVINPASNMEIIDMAASLEITMKSDFTVKSYIDALKPRNKAEFHIDNGNAVLKIPDGGDYSTFNETQNYIGPLLLGQQRSLVAREFNEGEIRRISTIPGINSQTARCEVNPNGGSFIEDDFINFGRVDLDPIFNENNQYLNNFDDWTFRRGPNADITIQFPLKEVSNFRDNTIDYSKSFLDILDRYTGVFVSEWINDDESTDDDDGPLRNITFSTPSYRPERLSMHPVFLNLRDLPQDSLNIFYKLTIFARPENQQDADMMMFTFTLPVRTFEQNLRLHYNTTDTNRTVSRTVVDPPPAITLQAENPGYLGNQFVFNDLSSFTYERTYNVRSNVLWLNPYNPWMNAHPSLLNRPSRVVLLDNFDNLADGGTILGETISISQNIATNPGRTLEIIGRQEVSIDVNAEIFGEVDIKNDLGDFDPLPIARPYLDGTTDNDRINTYCESQIYESSANAKIAHTSNNTFNKTPSIDTNIVVHVFPNPSNDQTTVGLQVFGGDQNVSIVVRNSQGQEVDFLYTGPITTGYQELKVKTSNLSNGVYFITITSGESGVYTKSFVVNHY